MPQLKSNVAMQSSYPQDRPMPAPVAVGGPDCGGHIFTKLEILGKEISDLHEMLSNLEGRINVAFQQEPTSVEEKVEISQSSLDSALSDSIGNKADGVREATKRIRKMLRLLEL